MSRPVPRPSLARLLTPEQCAELLGVTPSALRDMRSRGDGPPFVRSGARWVRYDPHDLIEWIDAHREHPKRRKPHGQ